MKAVPVLLFGLAAGGCGASPPTAAAKRAAKPGPEATTAPTGGETADAAPAAPGGPPLASATGKFAQLIDHFDPANKGTFAQRYYLDSSQAAASDAPVFLSICGEAECTEADLDAVRSFSADFHAYAVALEHRYFGTSYPVPDLSVANLRFVSTAQAVEDLATFIKGMRSQGLTGPWFAVGGSYAGDLAAFLREKHPELVAGALASSATVNAVWVDPAYDQFVATHLPPGCAAAADALISGFDGAGDQATLDAAASQLGVAAGASSLDLDSVVTFGLGYAVQYDDRTGALCAAVAQNDLGGIRQVVAQQNQDLQSGPTVDVTSTAIPPHDATAGRVWAYLGCTDRGGADIHSGDQSVTSPKYDAQSYEQGCIDLFGTAAPEKVDARNAEFYQPLLSSATRILFTNGVNDPWRSTQITSVPTGGEAREIYVYTIDDGAHCSDLPEPYHPDAQGTPSQQGARAKFEALVQAWLPR